VYFRLRARDGVDELEPTRESILVDLIDRVLVKGVVLHANIVISVANIPLIGCEPDSRRRRDQNYVGLRYDGNVGRQY